MPKPKFAAYVVFCVGVLSIHGTAQTTLKDELTQGASAFKELRYEQATLHFQSATALEPQNEIAHLYLAAALNAQYIPGIESSENLHFGQAAIAEYQKVLEINPRSVDALKGPALINLQMKKFEIAKSFYQKAIDFDASDPESYYTIGVIDWTESFTKSSELRSKSGKRADEPLIDVAGCWTVRESNQAVIRDGIEKIAKAIELRPDYDDAMVYMNLLYREMAKIECGDPQSYAADVRTADRWTDLVMSIKKKKAEQADHNAPKHSDTHP